MKKNLDNLNCIVIPPNVRFDIRLSPGAKILFGEICSQCNETGSCICNTKYLADLYSVDVTTVSRWIRELRRNKYIECETKYTMVEHKTGIREVERRFLKITAWD